jgi:uncharacterized membrane protein SirB2
MKQFFTTMALLAGITGLFFAVFSKFDFAIFPTVIAFIFSGFIWFSSKKQNEMPKKLIPFVFYLSAITLCLIVTKVSYSSASSVEISKEKTTPIEPSKALKN